MRVDTVLYSGFGRDDDPFYSIEVPILHNGDYFIDARSINRLDLSSDSLKYYKMDSYYYSLKLSIYDKNTVKVVIKSIDISKDYDSNTDKYFSAVHKIPLNRQKLARLLLPGCDTFSKNLGILMCYDWGTKQYAGIEYHDKYLKYVDIDIPIEFDEYLLVSGYCNFDTDYLVIQSINDYKVFDTQSERFIDKQIDLVELKSILEIIAVNINITSVSRQLFNNDDSYFLNCLNVYKEFKHLDCKSVFNLKNYILNYIDYKDN